MDENYVNDRIERYVYQVRRSLPRKNRDDIEKEIRSLIGDMLAERCGDRTPQQKDVDIVLIELGDPRALAGQYTEQGTHYLIGPALFPRYIQLLKIVGICVAGGITLATIIQSLLNTDTTPLAQFGNWLFTMMSALMGMFTWITVIFAFIENRESSRIGKAMGEAFDEVAKEFSGQNDDGGTFLDHLPEVPAEKAAIPVSEPIAGIVFTSLFLVLFVVAPQLLAVYIPSEAGLMRIPLFNPDVIRTLILPMAACLVLGLAREIFRLIEGRHSIRMTIVTVLCDLPALFLMIYILTRKDLFNPNLMDQLQQHWPDLADIAPFFQLIGPLFIVIIVFAYLIDMVTALVKGIKYN